jgi:DNA-binding transcriptional regulator YiaG
MFEYNPTRWRIILRLHPPIRLRIYSDMNEIRSIRQQLGLSQSAFAERMGVRQATVSRWETGEIAVPDRLVMAAQFLLQQNMAAESKSVA